MLKNDAAAYIAGLTSEENKESSQATNVHLITGTVEETSEDGRALVSIDGMVFSEDDSQYIEMDTIGGLEEGDTTTILLTGDPGHAMNPLAIGSVGGIDRIVHRVTEVYTRVEANEASIENLEATTATVENLEAATARIGVIENDYLKTADMDAERARVGTLLADKADVSSLSAATARIDDLEADHVSVDDFEAEQANIDNLQAATADIETIRANSAKVTNLTAAELEADHAAVGNLSATYATIDSLDAAEGRIGTLETENTNVKGRLTAAEGNITTLNASKANVGDLTAATGRITDLEATRVRTSDLEANYITADAIESTYTKTDFSNADVAWIQNGVIKDGSISSAMINDVSANKLTAGTINAEEINVTNLRADNLKVSRVNGQPVIGGYSLINQSGTGYSGKNPKSEGWYELGASGYVLTNDTSVVSGKAYYTTSTSVELYDQAYIDGLADDLNDRIDGAIETHTGTTVPTLNNAPASSWSTTALRDEHVGDVYYVVNSQSQQNGYCYRFTKSGGTYSWQLIKDSDVTAALSRLTTAEGKITTFDSDISQLKTDTGTLTTKTTSLETRMSDAEDDILDKVDTTTFNEVSDTVDGHTQSITQMTTTLSNKADSSTVSAVTQRVSKNEQDISGINTTIGELSTTVASKADGSTVETMSSKLNTVSDTVDGHTQKITAVENTLTTKADSSTVSTLSTKVNNVSDTVDGHTSQLASITSTQTTLQTDYATFKQTTEQFESTVGTTYATKTELKGATDDITELEGRVSTNETAITQNATNIASKVSTTDYNGTTIASLINQSADSVIIEAEHVEIDGEAVFSAINGDTSSTKISGGKIDASSITIGQGQVTDLTSDISAIQSEVSNTLIYDHVYEYSADHDTATFTALLFRAGEDVKSEFDASCFTWYYKTESSDEHVYIGSGYTCTVTLSDMGYGGHIIGKFTVPNDAELLTSDDDSLATSDGETTTARVASGDSVRISDLSVSTLLYPTDKLLVSGPEDEHLVTVESLQSYLEASMAKMVYFDTTSGWNAQTSLVSDDETLYVYTDRTTDSHGNALAGIKVGDGSAYVIDLPFINADFTEHLGDSTRHITNEERAAWNNKVRAYYAGSERLILTTS